MIETAEVFLWGTRIGVLHQRNGDSTASFEYDRYFQRSGIELSPFMMPLSGRIYAFPELNRTDAFRGVPGLFADSLPDRFGNAVINRWLSEQGRAADSFSAIERLCYIGRRGMGALEYAPATGPAWSEQEVDVTEMTRLASDVLSGKESRILRDHDASIAQLMEIGSSAGGARAKAIIAWNEETGEVKSGQVDAGDGFEYWIIKFDGVTDNGDHNLTDGRQYSLIEYAYYRMALDLGIEMSECRIFEKDGLKHFMTKRFDRKNGDKIHMQTLAALGHFDYNVPNLCSYETYADMAMKLGVGRKGVEQIYRRMVYCVLSGNCDDHVKNAAFLMNRRGEWSVSPAYDLTFAFHPDNRWISRHQMSVNGKSSGITEADLLLCGRNMGLPAELCRKTIAETELVIGKWMTYAEQAGITESRAEEIQNGIRLSNQVSN
ncbi:MAG: type II toxin-antitoxin system HipA family toxin [Lachnospiraceae bacterium]|nr:type II toxin-antitoxin system HipA family toxin [Lachnospiraceae bacterium]